LSINATAAINASRYIKRKNLEKAFKIKFVDNLIYGFYKKETFKK
jgi:hypothetical protein